MTLCRAATRGIIVVAREVENVVCKIAGVVSLMLLHVFLSATTRLSQQCTEVSNPENTRLSILCFLELEAFSALTQKIRHRGERCPGFRHTLNNQIAVVNAFVQGTYDSKIKPLVGGW